MNTGDWVRPTSSGHRYDKGNWVEVLEFLSGGKMRVCGLFDGAVRNEICRYWEVAKTAEERVAETLMGDTDPIDLSCPRP